MMGLAESYGRNTTKPSALHITCSATVVLCRSSRPPARQHAATLAGHSGAHVWEAVGWRAQPSVASAWYVRRGLGDSEPS